MHNERKHIVIISIALYLIVGVVACVNEDTNQSEIGSRQLTVQNNGANTSALEAQAEKVSQQLSGADAVADDSRCPCGHNYGFVDEDNDGKCDHAGKGGCQCQGRHGQGFIDEDDDGVCDHAGKGGCQCQGRHGQGFIDEDNDGICDRAKTNECGCRGRHRGGMRGRAR